MDASDQYLGCLCRTCMNEVESPSNDGNLKSQPQWLTIFDRIVECGGLRIVELLSTAVPQIEVQLSDQLPKKICGKCLQRLLSAYRFQQMCAHSEERMRQLVSKTKGYVKMSAIDAAIERELTKVDTDAYPLINFLSITLENLQHPSIQEPLLEAIEQVVESGTVQSNATENLQSIDPSLDNCKNSQGELTEFIRNGPNIEYSNGGTIHSTISVSSDEVLSIESDEQQVIVVSPHHHHHEKKDNSNLCGKKYSTPRIDEKNAGPTLKKHECALCDNSFKTAIALKGHLRTHTGERRKCERSSSSSRIRGEHRTNHTKDKTIHEKMHKGFELQTCDICGKRIRKLYLKQHKLIHSDEKPHKCDFCEKRFKRPDHLHQHIRTHTGEKPFKCQYCERPFVTKSNLIGHLRTHLGSNVYRCKICPLAFPSATELRLHFATHKNDDAETCERNMKAMREEEAKLELELLKRKTQRQLKEEQKQQVKIISSVRI